MRDHSDDQDRCPMAVMNPGELAVLGDEPLESSADRLVALGKKLDTQIGNPVEGVHVVKPVEIQLAQVVMNDDDLGGKGSRLRNQQAY